MAPNVTDVHSLSDAQLRWLYANAEALIAIAREDFGLTPVEAYQFGKPVVALRAGGYLDTVIEGVTGVFADSDTVDGIRSAVSRLSEGGYDPAGIAAQATRFAERSFAAQISEVVRSAAIGS
jgi:glycosyltransferase involved in cell wall biosynthesis